MDVLTVPALCDRGSRNQEIYTWSLCGSFEQYYARVHATTAHQHEIYHHNLLITVLTRVCLTGLIRYFRQRHGVYQGKVNENDN